MNHFSITKDNEPIQIGKNKPFKIMKQI